MSIEAPVRRQDNFFLGEDRTLRFYITKGQPIVMGAKAPEGATSLTVEPLKEALANGTKVRFPGDVVVTLSAAAGVGATSLSTSAISGTLYQGQVGRVISDVTNWTFEWVLRDWSGGSSALITKNSASGVTIVDATNGVVDVTISDSDTLSLAEGEYFHTLRRTNDGAEVILAFGPFVLRQPATRD